MSEPETGPSPSLIQQRMALQRPKTSAIWMIAIFGINAAWWLFRAIFDDGGGIAWALGIGFAGIVVAYAFLLRNTRRQLRAFEDRYGADAGRQM